MKKLLLFCLAIGCSIAVGAQTGVSSLSQNFDGVCTSSTAFPPSWLHFNPINSTVPNGQWMCDPTHGRTNLAGSPTPGVSCTGVWSGAYHLDTSYLITPLFDFKSHVGKVYLYFDSKTDSILLGGKLQVVIYRVDTPGTFNPADSSFDLSVSMFPQFTSSDSANWVTHYVDLTSHCDSTFYVAFKYISTATTGSQWFLDNMLISYYRLDVPVVEPEILPVVVRGISTTSSITLSFGSVIKDSWQLGIYDMMGRQVYSRNIVQPGYVDTYTITDAALPPGLYVIKMTNGSSYGTAKLSVQ